MLDETSLELFGRMPRGVGTPLRWQISTIEELENFIANNDGINNCFVDCYPANKVIDKIFIDCDYGDDVLGDAQAIAKYWYDNDWDYVPVATARKGYHIYLRLKPKRYGLKSNLHLLKATYAIIKEVFGEFRGERIKLGNKKVRVLRNKDRIIAPDPKCIGDVNRLTRIPNTLRPSEDIFNNSFYCTYLPPDKFYKMTESEIYKHVKEKHTYDYTYRRDFNPMLTDFDYDFKEDSEYDDWKPFLQGNGNHITSETNMVLERLLRPCLYHNVAMVHPDEDVRGAVAIDLLRARFDPVTILKIFHQLGWEDFNEEKTLYHIKSFIKPDGSIYNPYSCTKLRELKIPTICCVK